LQEVVDRTRELLDGNFFVRLQAVVILSRLNLVEGNPTKRIEEEAYIPAAEPLLAVVNDETQHDALKIVAVRGLGRIASTADLDAAVKLQMAQAFIDELGDPALNDWYQFRLVEALGTIENLVNDQNGQPFIVKALSEALVDRERHWLVRCEAAKSLGRTTLDRNINVGLLTFEMVRLARDMTEAQQKNPGEFYWMECFWRLYLAFKPEDKDEKQRIVGLLDRAEAGTIGGQDKSDVVEAYKQIIPVAKIILNNAQPAPTPIPAANLNTLDQWLKNNQPANLRVAPGLQPIVSPNVQLTDPVSDQNSSQSAQPQRFPR
jgi:hypothetical protein